MNRSKHYLLHYKSHPIFRVVKYSIVFILILIIVFQNINHQKQIGIKNKELRFLTDKNEIENLAFLIEYCNGNDRVLKEVLYLADLYGVDYVLILSVIKVESNFRKYARGYNKDSVDLGYMQLNSKVFKEVDDIFDKNIQYGVEHLKWCLDKAGNTYKGLAYYNAGIGKVKGYRAGEMTFDYVNKVMTEYNYIKENLK